MRILPIALAVLVVSLVSGCIPAEPLAQTPAPQPTSTPVFASEEEALAAAVAAYAAYLEMSDFIASEGGVNPERIAPFVTADILDESIESFGALGARKLRTDGASTFTIFDVEQYEATEDAAEIVLYVCLDVSSVLVRDSSGANVTPTDRTSRLPLEVGFLAARSPGLDVRVDRSDSWAGDDFCA